MENSQQLTPICTYNKQIFQVCFSPKCKQVCFICYDNKCQCKSLHKKCDMVYWDYICDNLDKNLIKNTQEFKSFSDSLDQLYQNAIKDITKCYDDFKKWRDEFGLTENQATFLHLINEGRFTELTSAKMYEIRKEIRTPSKIIMKQQNQLKQETGLINEYTDKLIEQLKGLYSVNKVIKEELEEQNKNKGDKIKIVENIQSKVNLAHKLLGLNENGSRFFTMINDGEIEKQLVKILDKINLNEQSINENKQAMELRFEKLTETVAAVAENADILKIEMKQQIKQQIKQIKQIKQDINNFQKNILEVDKKIKIYNHKSMSTQKYSAFDSKIKNSKTQIIEKQLEIQSKELKLFPQYFLEAQFKLKNEFLKKFEALQIKNSKLLNEQVKNDIPSSNLVEQLTKLEKEALDIQQEMTIKINQMPSQTQSIKIQCISKFFTKKLKKLNLLYRASENNFQVSKFWDKCNGKTNTLTILKTQFGKIIGGYTPLAWNKSLHGNYQQDTTKQTFLFSITQKHKIPITQNQGNALYHHTSYGPTFGGGYDLYICNKANVTGSSYGNIGYTYNNGDYTYGSQQAYKKWSGQSSGSSFLIQQWEVYEITFE